jgi:hypothetical protein
MRRTARLPLPLLLITLVLAGCTQPDPMPTPPPTPSAVPVFASDEEALAAAEEAYGKFLSATDAVIRDGGAAPERVEAYLSPELYDREVAGYEQLAQNGWHGVGSTTFELTLQYYDEQRVVTYACDDVSETDVLDSNGNSVVLESRATRVAYEVEFDAANDLRIMRKDVWSGGGVC